MSGMMGFLCKNCVAFKAWHNIIHIKISPHNILSNMFGQGRCMPPCFCKQRLSLEFKQCHPSDTVLRADSEGI